MVVKAPLALVESGMLPLVARLWRDWMRPYWRELTAIIAIVALLAGASSLYPVVIKAAFDAFDTQNKRVVQLIPFVVILVTAVKGFAMLEPDGADQQRRHADRGGHAGGAL